jgi:hypothetical protein
LPKWLRLQILILVIVGSSPTEVVRTNLIKGIFMSLISKRDVFKSFAEKVITKEETLFLLKEDKTLLSPSGYSTRLVYDLGDGTVLKTPDPNPDLEDPKNEQRGLKQNQREYRRCKKFFGKYSFIPEVFSLSSDGRDLVMKKYNTNIDDISRAFQEHWNFPDPDEQPWINTLQGFLVFQDLEDPSQEALTFISWATSVVKIPLWELADDGQWAVDEAGEIILIDLGF